MTDVADICIVGSGPSSYFLTKSLLESNPKLKVVVLEAGKGKIDTGSPLSQRQSYGHDFKLKPTINIGKGGTSQLWHNVLAPLDRNDFDYRSWIPMSGWPISLDELETYYQSVAQFFGFDYSIFEAPNKFFQFDTESSKVKIDQDVFKHKVFVHPLKYLRTDRTFKQLSKKYPSLVFKQPVIALRFHRTGLNDVLEVYDQNTCSFESIRANNYVLSAGALNNPEILLNSPHFAKTLPLLGKCLMDHPMGNFYQYRYDEKVEAKLYSGIKFQKQHAVKAALTLKDDLQEKHGLGNSALYLRPSFSEGYNNKSEELKLKLLTVRSKIMSFKVPFGEISDLAQDLNMVSQIIQYKTGFLSSHDLTDCMFVTEQRPSRDSNALLTDKINIYGNYQTNVNWNVCDKDLNEVTELYSIISNHLMHLNGASSTYDPSYYSWRQRLSSAAHHLGTARMSTDAGSGCVDSNLKIFGSNNVYVCDGSVFPTSGNANPTFTCMALAERLGRYLTND